jgi:predicted nucleic acid-binding protein
MIRVVLDTNILISALLQQQGLPARSFLMTIAGTTAQLCVSSDIHAGFRKKGVRQDTEEKWDDIANVAKGASPQWIFRSRRH